MIDTLAPPPRPGVAANAPIRSGPRRPAMLRSIHAELIKLTRTRVLAGTAAAVAAVALVGTSIGIAGAEPAAGPARRAGELLTTHALADAGGGTAVFAQTAGFMSAFLLAVLIGAVAAEFTRGTFRTMLLQQPGRVRVLVGKVAAIVGFAAVATALAEMLSWLTARLIAPGQGIDTTRWDGADALIAGAEDFARALVFLVGTALLATMVGVLARSVPLGVGAGLVWAGPIENIIGDSWQPGERFFPGLLLRAVISPGSTTTSTSRALVTLAVYGAIALTVTAVALHRRDVTS